MDMNYNVSIATISRTNEHETVEHGLLEASDGNGRKQRLTADEERMVCEAALELHNNGPPLRKVCLRQLSASLISTFQSIQLQRIGLRNG